MYEKCLNHLKIVSTLADRPMKYLDVQPAETNEWANMLIRVLYEAWRKSNPFKRLVLEEIFIAVNLNRPNHIPEIRMTGMEMEGAPPQLENAKLCSIADYLESGADPK